MSSYKGFRRYAVKYSKMHKDILTNKWVCLVYVFYSQPGYHQERDAFFVVSEEGKIIMSARDKYFLYTVPKYLEEDILFAAKTEFERFKDARLTF